MSITTKATFLRKVAYLADQSLHQFSRVFYWVRPLPERALALTDWYMFPLIVLSGSRPFGRFQVLSLVLTILSWVYYLGVVAFATIAIQARNETWRGLATGEYTFEMIDEIAGMDHSKAR